MDLKEKGEQEETRELKVQLVLTGLVDLLELLAPLDLLVHLEKREKWVPEGLPGHQDPEQELVLPVSLDLLVHLDLLVLRVVMVSLEQKVKQGNQEQMVRLVLQVLKDYRENLDQWELRE